MSTPSPGPQTPSSDQPQGVGRRAARRAREEGAAAMAAGSGPGGSEPGNDSGIGDWSVLPLSVRISGRSTVPDIDTADFFSPETEDSEPIGAFVPTAQGIRKVLGHHRAVAASAEGPDYLQIAVLIDGTGRTATVGEHGRVIAGDGVEEIAATVHRITGQQLEPQHPRLRRALLQPLDAPELPLLASTAGLSFRAVSRDGWSIILADDEAGWWSLRTGARGIAVALASDGAARSLEVLLEPADGDHRPSEDAAEFATAGAAACGLSWGPAWIPVSIDDDGTAAARLTREVVELCGGDTSQVHVESVASVFDLDPVQTTRLSNYVDGDSSSLVLESVLQLLQLPVLAAKLVEGQKTPEEIEGMTRYEPSPVPQALLKGLTQRPSGRGAWAQAYAVLAQRPGILLAIAGTETAAGVGLAALARRGGRGARVLGTLSGLAFTDAATVSALYAAMRRRRRDERDPEA